MRQSTKILLLSLLIIGSSCRSSYQKLLRSNDLDLKYAKAVEYYEAKKYYKALPLLEELTAIYRGTNKGEKLYYYYAYCNFGLEDYITSAYHFKQFAETYANSEYTEECRYMTAYCNFLLSPIYSLDQRTTIKAIESFQLFINLYPYSDRVPTANNFIDRLRSKLERKAYENAKLYFTIEDYRSAQIALDNAIEQFPDSKYVEEMVFLSLESSYLYAKNSVLSKQKERFEASIIAYEDFVRDFPDSEYLLRAEGIYEQALKSLERKL